MLDHTTLNDLRGREFGRSLRGYAPGEVDEFIEKLLFEAGQLVDAVGTLNQQLRDLQDEREEIKKREEQLSATLVAAQATADEWKGLAKKEGEQIVREAHLKAEEILQRAHRESEELLREARERSRSEEESRTRLRHETEMTVSRLRGELSSFGDALSRWEKTASEMGENASETPKEIRF